MVSSSVNKKPIEIPKEAVQLFSIVFIIGIILNIIFFILFILIIVFHYAMYTWTTELEKNGCDCSNLWHRNVIKWFAVVIIILNVIYYLIDFFNINQKLYYYINRPNGGYTFFAGPPLGVLIAILVITYLAIIYDYITKLKKLECECSESWKKEYGYIGSIVYMSLLVLGFLLMTAFVLYFLKMVYSNG
jgi:magnesium-transporting ATPase (P-type)